jgi:hypothetical protein
MTQTAQGAAQGAAQGDVDALGCNFNTISAHFLHIFFCVFSLALFLLHIFLDLLIVLPL